jgi:hypothetical protein
MIFFDNKPMNKIRRLFKKLNKKGPSNIILKFSNLATIFFGFLSVWLMIKYGENKEMIRELENQGKLIQYQIYTLGSIAKESFKQTKQLQRQIDLLNAEIRPEILLKIGSNDGKLVQAFLLNSGKTARIKKIVFNKNNNLKLITNIEIIGEGKEKEMLFEITNIENPILDITIIFFDIDGKRYSKRILIEGYKKIFDPEPSLELN